MTHATIPRAPERKHSWAARPTPWWPQYSVLQQFKDPNYHYNSTHVYNNLNICKIKQPCQSQLYNIDNIKHYADNIIGHHVKKFFMTSKLHHDVKKYFMTSKSSWWQKVPSWWQKVRPDVKKCVITSTRSSWRQKYVMTQKIRHKVRHDVKNTS